MRPLQYVPIELKRRTCIHRTNTTVSDFGSYFTHHKGFFFVGVDPDDDDDDEDKDDCNYSGAP